MRFRRKRIERTAGTRDHVITLYFMTKFKQRSDRAEDYRGRSREERSVSAGRESKGQRGRVITLSRCIL